jgi:hypothetical protein
MSRAEFFNTFDVAGGGVQWDSGPVTMDNDVNKTKRNDFCTAGPINGSITFTKSGYYTVSLLVIPTGNPGNGWTKLVHSNGGVLIGMDNSNEGLKYETYICTAPTWFAAGEYIRSTLSYAYSHTINTRWKVVRSPHS